MLRNRILKLSTVLLIALMAGNLAMAQSMKEAGALFNGAMKSYKAKKNLDKAAQDINSCIEMCDEINTDRSDDLKSNAQKMLPKVYRMHAQMVYKQGKVKEALEIMEKGKLAAEAAGESKQAKAFTGIMSKLYFKEGMTHKEKGEYDDAIAMFDKSLKVNPKLMNAVLGLAICYDSLQQYSKMLAVLDDGMLKARQCSDAKNGLQMRDMACNHLKKRAVAFQERKKLDSAVVYYQKATEFDKRNANLYLSQAICYKDMKQHAKSVECSKKAIELAPGTMDKAQIYFLMAQSLQALNKKNEACEAYRHAAQGMDYKKTSEYQMTKVLKCK